jgi:hypothetical protein
MVTLLRNLTAQTFGPKIGSKEIFSRLEREREREREKADVHTFEKPYSIDFWFKDQKQRNLQ